MLFNAQEARQLAQQAKDDYVAKADAEIEKRMPQIEAKIAEACQKGKFETFIELSFPKDFDIILRQTIRDRFVTLLRNKYDYSVYWEDTSVKKACWYKPEETIVKFEVTWG